CTYEIIYNGVELTDSHYVNGSTVRTALGISPSAFVIGCVGGFRPVKGQKYLVEAARELLSKRNGFKVVFLGNGPTQPDVKNYAMNLGLARNVAFLGYRQDVNRVLAAVDLFVAPSESEGISIAILEAMALQKPVVATRVGGTPEIVHDGRSGILVEPQNSSALADAIWKVWQDEKLRSQMAVEARRRVEKRFSLRSTVQNYQRIYDELAH
ncbi:MAG: glycosyltransferase, partial [bacterium]